MASLLVLNSFNLLLVKVEEIHKEKEELESQLAKERLEGQNALKNAEEAFANRIQEMEAQWQGNVLVNMITVGADDILFSQFSEADSRERGTLCYGCHAKRKL